MIVIIGWEGLGLSGGREERGEGVERKIGNKIKRKRYYILHCVSRPGRFVHKLIQRKRVIKTCYLVLN